MDALIIPEHPESDPQTGAVHACGHCCQTAALVGIAAALKTVLAHSDEELFRKGQAARAFVLEGRNNVVQAKRILTMLER